MTNKKTGLIIGIALSTTSLLSSGFAEAATTEDCLELSRTQGAYTYQQANPAVAFQRAADSSFGCQYGVDSKGLYVTKIYEFPKEAARYRNDEGRAQRQEKMAVQRAQREAARGGSRKKSTDGDYGLPELNKKASETDRTLRNLDRLNRTFKRLFK